MAKEESKADRLRTVLYNLTESIVIGASLLKSFMPSTGAEILEQLSTTERDCASLSDFGLYPSGNKVVADPKTLFERKDWKEVEKEVEKITEAQIAKAQAEEKKEAEKHAGKAACASGSSQAAGNTDLEKGFPLSLRFLMRTLTNATSVSERLSRQRK